MVKGKETYYKDDLYDVPLDCEDEQFRPHKIYQSQFEQWLEEYVWNKKAEKKKKNLQNFYHL